MDQVDCNDRLVSTSGLACCIQRIQSVCRVQGSRVSHRESRSQAYLQPIDASPDQAVKPLAGVVNALAGLSVLIPQDLVSTTTSMIPQAQIIVFGALLLAAIMLGLRTLED